LPELISKLFLKHTAAHEDFPTCSIINFNVAENNFEIILFHM